MKWTLVIILVLAVYIGYTLVDIFDPESVKGKKVLVTGASAGIGEQLAYHYARLGASVVVTARTESKLQEVVDKCREVGLKTAKFHYVTADMSDLRQTEHVVQNAVEYLGGLDILVPNHVMMNRLEPWRSRPEDLERLKTMIDINFLSYVHLASHAMPHLEHSASGGRIVVLSSLTGKKSIAGLLNYSTTKFALEGFFDGLRQEHAIRGTGVSVTVCILGSIETESNSNFVASYMVKDETPVPADLDATTLSIIKGGMLRLREVHYPPLLVTPTVLFKDWFPGILDYMIRLTIPEGSFNEQGGDQKGDQNPDKPSSS